MKLVKDSGQIETPQSLEAERSVLGALLLDNSAWGKVNKIICENDFYAPSHRFIFRVMGDLISEEMPIDPVTVLDKLSHYAIVDIDWADPYIYELANNVPSTSNIDAYARIVAEKSVQRSLINIANDIKESE